MIWDYPWGDCSSPFPLLKQKRGTKRSKWLCESSDLTKEEQLSCLKEEKRIAQNDLKCTINRLKKLQNN